MRTRKVMLLVIGTAIASNQITKKMIMHQIEQYLIDFKQRTNTHSPNRFK